MSYLLLADRPLNIDELASGTGLTKAEVTQAVVRLHCSDQLHSDPPMKAGTPGNCRFSITSQLRGTCPELFETIRQAL